MAELSRTADQLAERRASMPYAFGSHLAHDPSANTHGLLLGETRFDPSLHTPDQISLLSLNELVTGEPYVQVRLPHQPMDIAIILHQPEDINYFGTGPKKQFLGKLLKECLRESRPGMSGSTYVYSVGEAAVRDYDLETTVIKTSGDPSDDAKTVAAISRENLTFILSDFEDLPLDQIRKKRFSNTVGIKVNHPLELALPANHGVIRFGGVEVNTDKPKDLRPLNEALLSGHHETLARMSALGIKMAEVVLDTSSVYGFDLPVADKQIAAAIRKLK